MPKRLAPIATATTALLPAELAASAAAAVQDILAEAASANTTRSYASALPALLGRLAPGAVRDRDRAAGVGSKRGPIRR